MRKRKNEVIFNKNSATFWTGEEVNWSMRKLETINDIAGEKRQTTEGEVGNHEKGGQLDWPKSANGKVVNG